MKALTRTVASGDSTTRRLQDEAHVDAKARQHVDDGVCAEENDAARSKSLTRRCVTRRILAALACVNPRTARPNSHRCGPQMSKCFRAHSRIPKNFAMRRTVPRWIGGFELPCSPFGKCGNVLPQNLML